MYQYHILFINKNSNKKTLAKLHDALKTRIDGGTTEGLDRNNRSKYQ